MSQVSVFAARGEWKPESSQVRPAGFITRNPIGSIDERMALANGTSSQYERDCRVQGFRA